MVKVEINSEANIRLFNRMNRRIVNSWDTMPSMAKHKQLFEATYGVKVEISESGNFWSHLEFPDEQSYTMALLKWL